MSIEEKSEKEKKIEIVHTIPKMSDIEREKNKKTIGNDLYEIFEQIHTQLES